MNISDFNLVHENSPDVSADCKRAIVPINDKYEIDLIRDEHGRYWLYVEHLGQSRNRDVNPREKFEKVENILVLQCLIHEMYEKYK